MKFRILIWFLLFATFVEAQVDFGIKAGINTFGTNTENSSLTVTNPQNMETFDLSVRETQYGYHAGLFFRFNIKNFSIQPEILFNSDNVDYSLKDFNDMNILNTVGNETYQSLDVPLMLGLKLGPIKILAGPVAHFFLNSTSDLTDENFYDSIYEEFDLGYQAGIGFDIWKLSFDLKYEGNLNKFGSHLVLFGEEVSFSNNENRILASIGFRF